MLVVFIVSSLFSVAEDESVVLDSVLVSLQEKINKRSNKIGIRFIFRLILCKNNALEFLATTIRVISIKIYLKKYR